MSEREVLILKIEEKIAQKRELEKKMTPDPMSGFYPGNDYNRSQMYSSYITELSKLDDEIYQFKELLNLLPKESTKENAIKREQIAQEIQGMTSSLRNLSSKLTSASTQQLKDVLSNQISDIQAELDYKKLILSLI